MNRSIYIIFLLLHFTACKTTIIKKENIKNLDYSSSVPKRLRITGKGIFESSTIRSGILLDMRIIEDSAIWLSVRSPFIGEVMKSLFLNDSAYIINKLNKSNSSYNYENSGSLIGIELSYPMIQSLVLGNPSSYEQLNIASDSIEDNDFTYMKVYYTHNNRIVYNVNKDDQKLIDMKLQNLLNSNYLLIQYDDFTSNESINIAKKIEIEFVNEKKEKTNLYIHSMELSISPDITLPFNKSKM